MQKKRRLNLHKLLCFRCKKRRLNLHELQSFRCKKRRLNLHKVHSFKCKKRRLNLHDGKCMPRLPQPVARHEWGGDRRFQKGRGKKSVEKVVAPA
jgi:hypothetical protein